MYYLRIFMPYQDKVSDVECESLAQARYVMDRFLGSFSQDRVVRDSLENARVINRKTGDTEVYFSVIFTEDWQDSL